MTFFGFALNWDRVVGALIGAIIAWCALMVLNQTIWLPQAERKGRALERAELDAATTKAIGELTNAADRARVNRRLCLERGGVYLNATGECQQGTPE